MFLSLVEVVFVFAPIMQNPCQKIFFDKFPPKKAHLKKKRRFDNARLRFVFFNN